MGEVVARRCVAYTRGLLEQVHGMEYFRVTGEGEGYFTILAFKG
jgi:hypothetical protein